MIATFKSIKESPLEQWLAVQN